MRQLAILTSKKYCRQYFSKASKYVGKTTGFCRYPRQNRQATAMLAITAVGIAEYATILSWSKRRRASGVLRFTAV
jgi:hypothetical protein